MPVTGGSLAALRWGDGSGTSVVFVHGFGNTASVWSDVVRELPSHTTYLAMDLRGHGDSDRSPAGRYSVGAFVADLADVLRQQGDPVSVVGHSLGGKVALQAAARVPELVDRVVVVDSGPELRAEGVAHLLGDVQRTPHRFGSASEYRTIIRQMYPLAADSQVDRIVAAELAPVPQGGLERKLDPVFADPRVVAESTRGGRAEMWQLLRLVHQPTLVVRGVASAMLSADVARRMVDEALPDARLVTIPRSGHAVPVDNPERLAAEICSFLRLDAQPKGHV